MFTDFHDFGTNATMVPNNYTFDVSTWSSQKIRHDRGLNIAAHRITPLPKFERTGSSKTPLVEFLRPRSAKYLVPFEARWRIVAPHGILKNYDNHNNTELLYGTKSMKNSEPKMKTRKTRLQAWTAMSWEKLDETDGSWGDVWKS